MRERVVIMAERFQRLFSLDSKLFANECPIIIEAGALQKDTESGAVLAQIKMRNLGEKAIASCKVSLKAFENNGNEVEGIPSFSYLDLNAAKGKEFGSKVPVFLPDKTARSFSVDINEIVFEDGTVENYDDNEWRSLPKQTLLEEAISDPELRKQLSLEIGGRCSHYPEKRDGFYLCACGAINKGEDATCYNCERSYETISPWLDTELLSQKAKQRLAGEAEKKKKNKRIAIIAGAIIALLILGSIVISSIQKANSLPFSIGDSYDTVRDYMKENAAEYDIGIYLTAVYGWVDYFGTGGDQYSQQLRIYFDDYDNVNEIEINALATYTTKIVEKIKRVYKVDTSSISSSGNTITMNGEGAKITIETGYEWKSTADHHPGEEVITITINKK